MLRNNQKSHDKDFGIFEKPIKFSLKWYITWYKFLSYTWLEFEAEFLDTSFAQRCILVIYQEINSTILGSPPVYLLKCLLSTPSPPAAAAMGARHSKEAAPDGRRPHAPVTHHVKGQ